MRQVQAPDLIATVLACLATVVLAYLGWSFLDDDSFWRPFVVSASVSPPPIVSLFWWLGSQRLRLWAYRWYYRFAGPRCTMQVLGNIPTHADDEPELLQSVLETAQRWDSRACTTLSVANRDIIKAGPRTLQVNVLAESPYAEEDEGDEDEECPEPDRQIQLTLYGYEGTLSRMDGSVLV